MSPTAIAFFDLDHTLIAINSAKAWMSRERRAGRMGRREALRAVVWFAMYRMGKARMDDVVRSAVLTLKDLDAELYRARTQAFWDEEVCAWIRPRERTGRPGSRRRLRLQPQEVRLRLVGRPGRQLVGLRHLQPRRRPPAGKRLHRPSRHPRGREPRPVHPGRR